MTLDDRKSAPSASLQALEDWEGCLIHQMFMLPFRGILASWTDQWRGTSWNLTKGNAKSCTCSVMSPHSLLGAGDQLVGKKLYRKVSGSPGEHQLEQVPAICCVLVAQLADIILSCIRSTASRLRQGIISPCLALRHIWSARSSSGAPNVGKNMVSLDWIQQRATKMIMRLECLSYEEWLRTGGEKGDLINVSKYLKLGGVKTMKWESSQLHSVKEQEAIGPKWSIGYFF